MDLLTFNLFPLSSSRLTPKVKDPATENVDRRTNSLAALKLICDSQVFFPHLEALLAMQDAQGNTPFMAAVACR